VPTQVRELYRERSALEREYAGKLQALARKAADKKSRKVASLVLGDEPTKAWDEVTLKQRCLPPVRVSTAN
jgi:formin-binding protein 1